MDLTIRCSSLARPMVCAGSLFFTDLPLDEGSDAAKEGTAAGELLERKLLGQPIGTHAANGVAFDADMEFYLEPIVQNIRARSTGLITCEQRIDWQTRSGIWIRGQYDVAYIDHEGALCIDDLKYGWGPVEVKENWQLLGYAIGLFATVNHRISAIKLRIMQPRPHHEDGMYREWTLTVEELMQYRERIEERMLQIAEGDKLLVTSPKCRYCPAASQCPALSKSFWHGVEMMHEFMEDRINENEISFQLDLIGRIKEIVKIKEDSLNTLAVDRVRQGKLIPNYAMEASYGDRKWKSGISPDIVKTLTGKQIVKQEMLSPAQAEKLGVSKDFVNALTERQFRGQKLKKTDTATLGSRIFGGQ